MKSRELKPNYDKGRYISDTHYKRLTNHNRLGQLTNQSRLGFSERWALKRQKLKQNISGREVLQNVQYEKNNIYIFLNNVSILFYQLW